MYSSPRRAPPPPLLPAACRVVQSVQTGARLIETTLRRTDKTALNMARPRAAASARGARALARAAPRRASGEHGVPTTVRCGAEGRTAVCSLSYHASHNPP